MDQVNSFRSNKHFTRSIRPLFLHLQLKQKQMLCRIVIYSMFVIPQIVFALCRLFVRDPTCDPKCIANSPI